MKKKTKKRERSDGLRREYDFSQLKEGVRGKYAARYDEDEETLAAIDEGLRDAKAGRTVPIEKVRKLLPKWITGSRSHSLNTPVTSSASPTRRKGHIK
jgi:hypothetical protein